jgi:hypothetical protein
MTTTTIPALEQPASSPRRRDTRYPAWRRDVPKSLAVIERPLTLNNHEAMKAFYRLYETVDNSFYIATIIARVQGPISRRYDREITLVEQAMEQYLAMPEPFFQQAQKELEHLISNARRFRQSGARRGERKSASAPSGQPAPAASDKAPVDKRQLLEPAYPDAVKTRGRSSTPQSHQFLLYIIQLDNLCTRIRTAHFNRLIDAKTATQRCHTAYRQLARLHTRLSILAKAMAQYVLRGQTINRQDFWDLMKIVQVDNEIDTVNADNDGTDVGITEDDVKHIEEQLEQAAVDSTDSSTEADRLPQADPSSAGSDAVTNTSRLERLLRPLRTAGAELTD